MIEQNFPYPSEVYRYFSEFAQIPHGSGSTDGIRQWALDTAKRLNLPAYADEAGNVIIRKPASPGYETHPRVILQGHLDMVCAQLPSCKKDMTKEGIDLVWDGDFLRADGTTLGGDDGIAIAYAFAILENNSIPHPPLTVILTRDEETGMDGAAGLSPASLEGSYLLNLDSEDEGIFTVGCAGGKRLDLCYPVTAAASRGTKLTLSISGLIGGHSGSEIHKPLLNANVTMVRLLSAAEVPFQLAALAGGVRDNVIPTECEASLLLSAGDADAFCDAVNGALSEIRAAYPNETGLTLHIDIAKNTEAQALSADATAALVSALAKLPNGVQKMNDTLHMPETSLNLGIFRLEADGMHVDALLRSGINREKEALAEHLRALAEAAGGSAAEASDYPAWEYVPGTDLEAAAVRVFTEQYGKPPVIQTIHAGVECGILAAKAEGLQCLSVGPDLFDIHTPRERLSIPSAARVWDFTLTLLAAL